jgi:protein-S-isoprenylcysteine O-methyltransferase Ste14
MRPAIEVTFWAWVLLELGLLVRDVVRGKGGTGQDRGTRRLIAVAYLVSVVAAGLIDREVAEPPWQLGPWHLAAGLVVLLAGLAIRVWAVLVLGAAFRTTVEVHVGQSVVDTGPYRWVRHPAYTGLLLIGAGIGLALGNWLSLALLVLVPLAAMLRRITVEEAILAEVMGEPYHDYQERTKRLVPGLW